MTTDADTPADGRITTERLDRVFAIGIDRPKKLNGFSPKMLVELAQAYTAFERDEEAWVGLLYAHGDNFTAGLELDKVAPVMRERGTVFPVGSIDPLSLRPPIRTKPLVAAVQGICFTLGIELMLAADIVVAADNTPLCADRGQARHHAGGRRHLPHGGAGGLGQRPALPADRRRVRRRRGAAARLRAGGGAGGAAEGARARHRAAGSPSRRRSPCAPRLPPRASPPITGPNAAIREFNAQQARLMVTEDAAEGVRSFVERRAGRFVGR